MKAKWLGLVGLALAPACADEIDDGPGDGSGGSAHAPDAAMSGGGSGSGDAGAMAGAAGTSTQCYSPTQNLGSAYADGAEGCPCDEGSVCDPPAALICQDGKWQAVEDGPCFPMDLDCRGRLLDVNDCLQFFGTCVRLSNGLFCGLNPRTDECSGALVQDAGGCLQDDAYCTELPSGLYCTGPSAPSCPTGYVPGTCPSDPVFWCFQFSESLSCTLGTLSTTECEQMGGEASFDPGDGSISGVGCPDEGRELGFIEPGGDEGALCCEPAP